MKKTYEITGMSCGGCVNSVKQALLKMPEVTEAEVQLHPQTAVVTMNKSIDVSDLQTQLSKAGHYSIKEVA
jgi:copper chaperone CopZ